MSAVRHLEYSPFSISEEPYAYQCAREVQGNVQLYSYGAVGIDEHTIGLDYFQEIIPKVTIYYNLQHIGLTHDSVVFQVNWKSLNGMAMTGVLKCIFDFSCSYESNVYECLSKGKPLEELGYVEPNEITLLKYAFLRQNDNWCQPLDMCYLLELRKIQVKRWLCVIFPMYQHTFHTINFSLLTVRQKKKMILELARAVHSLHQIGYYHGDLKPKNICSESSGQVRLIDFGTASKIDNVHSLKWIKNTYGYFSPIQCFNHLVQESIPDLVSRLPKGLLHELKLALGMQGIAVCLHATPTMERPMEYIPEHGFSNDLFVLGLIMSFLFDKTYQHFFLKGYIKKCDSLELLIRNVIEFVRDSKAYLKDYYKQVSFPKVLKPVFEFCIGQWNVHHDRVTIVNTSEQLVKMLSVV